MVHLNKELNVQERILQAAKQEFLHYGFKDASLRRMSSTVGVTTGAIYTYYKCKQALFDAVVAPVCDEIENIFSELSESYYSDDCVISEITYEKTIEDITVVYDFIYKYFDIFRILLTGADRSSQSDFIHVLVNHEVNHTIAYLERLKIGKNIDMHLDTTVIHTISEGYINALFEPVRHNMDYEDARKNLNFIVTFYTGGWLNVCGKFSSI